MAEFGSVWGMAETQKKSRIVYRKLGQLIPYARNARTHSDSQITRIASSIREFGFTNPVLIDGDNGIIAGHGRVMAAERLDITELPCIILAHLTEQQKRAYVIADNRMALDAGWDDELLKLELADLEQATFDLSLTGFSEEDIQGRIGLDEEDSDEGENAVPPVEDKPVSIPGDVWRLGGHRLCCGDSTVVQQIERLMDGKPADLIVTDPPYGMSYSGGRAAGEHVIDKKTGEVKIKAHGMIMNDDLRGDALTGLVRDALALCRQQTKAGAAAYVCLTWRTYSAFEAALVECGFTIKACIVWDKQSIGLGRAHYRGQHEFIFYCDGQWHGDKSQSDVWAMRRGNTAEYVHPTQKPVELIERAIQNSSKVGDIVLDAFGGSGATLIACEKTNRHARLMELDPKYVDVIVRRWQQFTGASATLESSGKTFDQVARARSRAKAA